jgi:hypothetical protein
MIAAGDAGCASLGFRYMSHFPSPHFFDAPHELANGNGACNLVENTRGPEHSDDRAIDIALRAVPIPDGLLTRLGRLVYTMPDDAPDHVDWLGC